MGTHDDRVSGEGSEERENGHREHSGHREKALLSQSAPGRRVNTRKPPGVLVSLREDRGKGMTGISPRPSVLSEKSCFSFLCDLDALCGSMTF
jgi:hypothetical protein